MTEEYKGVFTRTMLLSSDDSTRQGRLYFLIELNV